MAQPSIRNRMVVRQFELLDMLRERPRTLLELAAAVGEGDGVTTRTIRRDLEALQSARFPIVDEIDGFGVRRWSVLKSNRVMDLCDAVGRSALANFHDRNGRSTARSAA